MVEQETEQNIDNTQENELSNELEKLRGSIWDNKVVEEPKSEEKLGTIAQEVLVEEEKKPIEIDYNAFVKEQFGLDSVDALKETLEASKKYTEAKPQMQFENEESKKMYEAFAKGKEDEIYDYLKKKKDLERLSTIDVNENVALDILKLNLKQKNTELSEDEVDFLLKKQYGLPKKPIQKNDELDEDYEVRENEWKELVDEKNKELIINAKLAKKEIEQLKLNIKLPSIETEQPLQVDQKELERQKQMFDLFQEELNSTYKSFNGVSVKAKCEDAEFLISYQPKETEKEGLKSTMGQFDLEQYFNPRWLTSEGKINTSKMMDDLYMLENKEAILQKVANESAAQMLLHIKQKNSNINFNNTDTKQETFIPNEEQKQMELLMKKIWS